MGPKIYALAISLLGLHLLTHDYARYVADEEPDDAADADAADAAGRVSDAGRDAPGRGVEDDAAAGANRARDARRRGGGWRGAAAGRGAAVGDEKRVTDDNTSDGDDGDGDGDGDDGDGDDGDGDDDQDRADEGGPPPSPPRPFSDTVSLTAVLFVTVLLGSRLASNEQVFAFVVLAIEVGVEVEQHRPAPGILK